jgi:hypothetical protein
MADHCDIVTAVNTPRSRNTPNSSCTSSQLECTPFLLLPSLQWQRVPSWRLSNA